MPHQCTNCSATFPDGSKEMLSGCPHCGGNTFQYIPEGATPAESPTDDEPPDPPLSDDSVTGRMGRAAQTVKEYVGDAGSEPEPDESADDGEVVAEDSTTEEPSLEDRAQASARGEVADLSDLPSKTASAGSAGGSSAPPTEGESAGETPPTEGGRVVDEPDSAADTDLETLREELNDQFESIRIVEPGQYELNLMELYDREEHIVALREDGKYMIEVPETWRDD
ncbi:MAG: OapC/ArvC family zinc-ribbon domain-containing protein [Halobacteriota archaeon]